MRSFLMLLLSLLVTLAVELLSSFATMPSIPTWYRDLVKSPLTPPAWAFAPVWSALYLMMAVAAWWVWRRAGWNGPALKLYAVQLALNGLWSFVFFAWRSPGPAFLEILLLEFAIFKTLRAFWRVSPLAGLLLVPYLLWVGFAAYLNLYIWWLNY